MNSNQIVIQLSYITPLIFRTHDFYSTTEVSTFNIFLEAKWAAIHIKEYQKVILDHKNQDLNSVWINIPSNDSADSAKELLASYGNARTLTVVNYMPSKKSNSRTSTSSTHTTTRLIYWQLQYYTAEGQGETTPRAYKNEDLINRKRSEIWRYRYDSVRTWHYYSV